MHEASGARQKGKLRHKKAHPFEGPNWNVIVVSLAFGHYGEGGTGVEVRK